MIISVFCDCSDQDGNNDVAQFMRAGFVFQLTPSIVTSGVFPCLIHETDEVDNNQLLQGKITKHIGCHYHQRNSAPLTMSSSFESRVII